MRRAPFVPPAALIWGGVCQVGSGDRAVVDFRCCCGSGHAWRPERRGRFGLICEGWVPQDGCSSRRGRLLTPSAPAPVGRVLIAQSRVLGGARGPPPPPRTGCAVGSVGQA